jgi:hypothetical protein
MGLYFKGRVVSDESILKQLGLDDPIGEYIGNRIWVWENPKTGETIITGDEGNSWCIILAQGCNKEEAMAKLKPSVKGTISSSFVTDVPK